MRHEHDVVRVAQRALDRVGIVLEPERGVLGRQVGHSDVVAALAQGAGHPPPAPGTVPRPMDKREDAHVLLVLWDIDGTLVDSAGHGRHAFEDAFRDLLGREPEWVEYAGRTDHQIALSMLNGSAEHLPALLEQLAAKLAGRKDAIAAEGRVYPGVPEALAALHEADGVVNSLLTGNIEANAAVKVGAFGLDRWLDFEAGAYGSDPHERRSDLVAIARERAAARYGEPAGAVLVGDTPLDVLAAREAGARAVAVATGFAELAALRDSGPDALLQDLRDTDAAIRAITST
jgi:phosphoglycolate phosphatase-like HAD superfamily hydrolase